MTKGMFKSYAVYRKETICQSCGEDIYTCDGCKEYFRQSDIIYCLPHPIENNKHYCESCYPKEKGNKT